MKNDFIKKLNKVAKAMDAFPSKVGITAVNFSKERFRMKNWLDRRREPWPPNSPVTLQAIRKRKGPKGSLMLRTGRLKRSVRKIFASRRLVIIGTDVPYARILNDGGTIHKNVRVRRHTRGRKGRKVTVKAHTRQMNIRIPSRRFIGESAVLMRRIQRLMERELKQALK